MADNSQALAERSTERPTERTESAEHGIMQLTVVREMADHYKLDVRAFVYTFRTVAMPQGHNNAELVSCLMVAHAHGLNPLTREIYFMRTRSGGIQPIIGVDGWMKKCNEHPQFDGLDFIDNLTDKGEPISTTCIIYRKDRTHPIKVTEYFDECSKAGGPVWKTSPKRMMRHRALTQCARYAFGFAGVMDRDEFDQWEARQARELGDDASRQRASRLSDSARRVANNADLPDIPDEAPASPAPAVQDAEVITDIDQAALIREIERKLEASPEQAADIELEYQTYIINMDEDGRSIIIEAIQEAKRIASTLPV